MRSKASIELRLQGHDHLVDHLDDLVEADLLAGQGQHDDVELRLVEAGLEL